MTEHLLDEVKALRAALRAAQQERDVMVEELRLMVSYLNNTDQDANHLWMVKHMRETLNGDPHVSENKKNP